MNIEKIHTFFLECDSVSIDTRKIESNSLFIALKGENFDANKFSTIALEKGAKYVIIDNKNFYVDRKTILVEDTLLTLQELAKYHRKYLGLPIIALTGSNGKTTTKELINSVLSKKYETKATFGNLNNHIGVPLTLLSFSKETEIGIVEMGANHQKEIEFLCEITQPDYGYITNFGKAHLEGFGGLEGVIKGKSEMYTFFEKNKKTVFVNIDDEIQRKKTSIIKKFTFSNKDKDADIFIEEIKCNPLVYIKVLETNIQSQLIGEYNSTNIIAAISMGVFFGIPIKDIKEAIESYVPKMNRSQIITKGTNKIILDAYNANPSSMKAALENFLILESSKKIIILGDMFELGDESKKEHLQIINYLNKNYLSKCYFVGKEFFKMKILNKNFYFYETFEQFEIDLKKIKFNKKSILIKGSRAMALERVLNYIN